ncbi:hypothetical protein, partial [Segatella copri]|uniref:hypothetical protein n=1 Tax=Segatella copri TaxID=165179 RepID=UPI001C7074D5
DIRDDTVVSVVLQGSSAKLQPGAKLHAYAVLHVCECKDKARLSKNKRFPFLWQYVAGVCRLQRQKQQEKLARLQRIHEQ